MNYKEIIEFLTQNDKKIVEKLNKNKEIIIKSTKEGFTLYERGTHKLEKTIKY